ncbi:uncharacterized protein [Musca autumnalis]|uniref:uncharacterized protein n=1 Tax=Musca autumnalis TaxID=221902 RepID=UPI003CEA1617
MDQVPPSPRTVKERKQQPLRIMQINLHHCKAAAAELLLSLTKSEVDIALVQEPYLFKNSVAGLSDGNYTTFATSNGDKRRRCYGSQTGRPLTQSHHLRLHIYAV